jgi:hypothetical protein
MPHFARPFPVPHIHEKTLKVEIDRSVEVGVLKWTRADEWAAPTFVIPKKDGSVRFTSDFRKLNEWLHRAPYPVPKMHSANVPWKWGEEQSKAFAEANKILSEEALLTYPAFDKPFVIHADASHRQLGAVVSQDNHPIAFHSRKLNDAQTCYATTERELLSVVETLKEFRMTLLGHKIAVWTDHKNLIHNDLKSERVLHFGACSWRSTAPNASC